MNRFRRSLLTGAVSLLSLGLLACGGGGDGDGASSTSAGSSPSTAPGHVSESYLDESMWLCRPGGDAPDACDGDLTATEVRRDLSTIDMPFEPAVDPSVDCFYLYPTVAAGPAPNAAPSDPRDAEMAKVRDEAARFAEACRVFAPWYPQSTAPVGTPVAPEAEKVAYDAARDAFLHYLDQDSGGRPFVLIGHGQGADLLARLVVEEIEPDPARTGRLVSAMLVGSTRVFVPPGETIGGTFATIPLCTDRAQTGCVIAYHAFQRGVPPPSGGGPLFAGVPEGMAAACTNPAGLDGSKGQFRGAYFPSSDPGLPPVATPFVLFREYYRGECTTRSGASYVAVDTTTDPNEARPLGPVESSPGQEADLGLYDVELELALGDLLALVSSQTAAHPGP